MMNTVLTFKYRDFKSPSTEFRLIRLKPSTSHDEILCCFIEHYPRENCPEYLALSYTWGLPIFRNRIEANGSDAFVTDSLHQALLAIRDEESEVFIWADALCINQVNKDEKSVQVQCMREIYSNASCVVSWLGDWPDSVENHEICARLDEVGKMSSEYHGADTLSAYVKATRENDLIKAGKAWEESERIYALVSDHCNTEATYPYATFASLTRVSYWTRVWIVQEHTIPKKIQYLWGRFRISSDVFRGLIFFHTMWFTKRVRALSDPSTNIDGSDILTLCTGMECSSMYGARNKFQTELDETARDNLLDLCIRANVQADPAPPLQATNSQDRIYALLGMSSDRSSLKIRVNFHFTEREVYTEAARAWLVGGTIHVLTYCQFERLEVDWPSWVPDWRGPLRKPICDYENTNRFRAAGRTSQTGEYIDNGHGLMRLRCVVVDTIVEIGDKWNPEKNVDMQGNYIFNYEAAAKFLSTIEAFVYKAAELTSTNGKSPEDADQQEAVWRIPVADQEQPPSGQFCRATNFSHKGYLDVKKGVELGLEEQENFTIEKSGYINMMGYLFNRRPFLSSKGFIGVGPGHVTVGDKIVVILGCYAPFVVRKLEGSETFQVIGEAYVHGIMDGEIMEDKSQEIVSIVFQ